MASNEPKRRADPSEVFAVLRRIYDEAGRGHLKSYWLAAFCLIALAATTGGAAWIMQPMIDDLFYKHQYDKVPWICGGIIGIFLVRGLATYGSAVTLAKIGNSIVAYYQKRVFGHLMKLGIDFYTETRSGQLAARINENVAGIRDLFSMTLKSIAGDLVALIGLVTVMVYQAPFLAASIFLIGPPLVWAVSYIMRRVRRVTRESVEINSHLIGAMQESVQGIAVVKAFTMEEQLTHKIGDLVDRAESRYNKIARVSERLAPVTEMLAGFAIAGVVAYSVYRSAYSSQPPGNIMSFITAFMLAYDPVRRLARTQVNVERAMVNARMIYELLDVEPRQGDAKAAKEATIEKGEIRFNDVTFGYTPDQPVIRNLSFTAAAGKTTAIVGASGAGKSTLVALLQRFYDVDGGTIEIDGQDISKVTKRSLRESIAFVSQQPYLFEGTISDNIRYGRPSAGDTEIAFAAQQAAADDFIRQQPQGYDTPVGENGVTLSGGQRQRLSIARAIVRQAPILLLDEATSALDNESEARVQQALTSIMQGRTTIVIAHRLSTVINADHIVVLEQGRLVEQGTHSELLARPNGAYAHFYNLQGGQGLGLVDDGEIAAVANKADGTTGG